MFSLLSTATSLYVSLFGGSALCVYFFLHASWQLPLPPDPRPKFLSGNVHQLPRSEVWKVFKQWSETFNSPITFHRIFARKFIVLNTLKAANDLLESHSNVYSNRPVSWMYMELINRKLAVLNISSQNLRFKVYRRLIHTGLNPRAVERYNGILSRSCRPSSSCIGRR
ncbi:hypothetical protein K503DRAFT_749771 [Rhizopogon vinicolor AM-OR11-026]|uniref:Cytochrome P450 n=1 Tax=Rhizopogon vinicolor AM-OR11-026 TaxID=1314800 RepID=A0A1B7MIU2_9AGAM|nr:hypothetical protein K503DRAFT_749771 [Rhizopogon vinicolor AM-OR11-026]